MRIEKLKQILKKKKFEDLQKTIKGQTCKDCNKENICDYDFLRWFYGMGVID